MGKTAGIFISILIVAMDIGAGILAFQAEVSQNRVKHLRVWIFECRDPSNAAFKLGLASAGILVLAHAIANLLSGCLCICSQEELNRASPHRQLSVACFILTWLSNYSNSVIVDRLNLIQFRPTPTTENSLNRPPTIHHDHTGDSIGDAGDRDNVKRQVERFMWINTPPFLLHWRDLVFRSCPLFCWLLHYCHCCC
ncbi:Protein VASCULATURE COMPLEXITY AND CONNECTIVITY [Linum perenne]